MEPFTEEMSSVRQGIPPEDFYGGRSARQDEIESIVKNSKNHEMPQLPKSLRGLLGPSTTWKVFRKQQDAINCCLKRRNGLMPFAFEDVNARRMFLAAHPKVFWGLNSNRFFKNCSSYEIIREYSACKLYLDIEYEYIYNRNKNDDRMLENVLALINYNLKSFFNITCTRDNILDLNSSSDTKFSHHVIYEIENVAFHDNYAVGNFLKRICGELKEAYESNSSGDNRKLLEISLKYNVPQSDVLELFVCNCKGETKLLIDEGVYTKNRHFRLLGSSKKFKNVPLELSHNNKYKPNKMSDLDYFLDSLVTYFSWKVNRVLEFVEPGVLKQPKKCCKLDFKSGSNEEVIHPQIDSFIRTLISPNGRIRRKVFFSDTSTIMYDIQDFRYCQNVGREHKSNNIKYIVDLQALKFYQKCYDPDCANFRSEMRRLPEEICFFFENDSVLMADFEEFSVGKFNEIMQQMNCNEIRFEQDVSDEDLENVAICAETMLDLNW